MRGALPTVTSRCQHWPMTQDVRLIDGAATTETFGVEVDVISDRGTGPAVEHIRAEAVAL